MVTGNPLESLPSETELLFCGTGDVGLNHSWDTWIQTLFTESDLLLSAVQEMHAKLWRAPWLVLTNTHIGNPPNIVLH